MTQSFRYWRCDANPTSPHNPELFTSTTAMIAMSKACDHSPIPPTPPPSFICFSLTQVNMLWSGVTGVIIPIPARLCNQSTCRCRRLPIGATPFWMPGSGGVENGVASTPPHSRPRHRAVSAPSPHRPAAKSPNRRTRALRRSETWPSG